MLQTQKAIDVILRNRKAEVPSLCPLMLKMMTEEKRERGQPIVPFLLNSVFLFFPLPFFFSLSFLIIGKSKGMNGHRICFYQSVEFFLCNISTVLARTKDMHIQAPKYEIYNFADSACD